MPKLPEALAVQSIVQSMVQSIVQSIVHGPGFTPARASVMVMVKYFLHTIMFQVLCVEILWLVN